jgi:hypothetical protein
MVTIYGRLLTTDPVVAALKRFTRPGACWCVANGRCARIDLRRLRSWIWFLWLWYRRGCRGGTGLALEVVFT